MYTVQVGAFEGPLDLLLFFIQRDEIDIYDIPISRIANEFLEYVQLMEEIQLDGIGDFLYMAAELLRIKAKMLLPQHAEEETTEDPRMALVERLLEYIRYKEAATYLSAFQQKRAQHFVRQVDTAQYRTSEEVWHPPTLYALVFAFKQVLERVTKEEPVHQVESEEYTLEEQQQYILNHVLPGKRVSFLTLICRRTRAFIIVTFLALLELIQQRKVRALLVDEQGTQFYVERISP